MVYKNAKLFFCK
uniref:Uncharacterized protein n=1 Tax=Anguilla anguilla TaxID=7936 RepID=A0A0E9QTI8_ANGAN